MLALLALPVSLLGMQQTIAERLDGRVPPDVGVLVQQLGIAASARGLPVDPLIQKAIEGSAKGVPAQRISAAVRLVERLGGEVAGLAFVIELAFLGGRGKLGDHSAVSLITYQ